jgi:hypothetical protein
VNIFRRTTLAVATGLLALGAAVSPSAAQAAVDRGPETAPAAVAAPRAVDSVTGRALPQWGCDSGYICFWTGPDGTGSRCAWDIADPDWADGGIRCSWALTTNVKSVFNKGTSGDGSTGVAYWTTKEFAGNRIGCTRNGQNGNLAGTYKIRSHKWISGPCGS